MLRFVLACFVLTLPLQTVAKTYNAGYLTFEMPDDWKCSPFGASHVCHSGLNNQKKKEAMIIVTVKTPGGGDKSDQYLKFLNQPRNNVGQPSKIITKSKTVNLNGHLWVEGWHQNSEVRNYYTRYEVTTCCGTKPKLAMLVTLSANVKHFKKYSKAFADTVASLRVIENVDMRKLRALGLNEKMGNIAGYMEDLIDSEDFDPEAEVKQQADKIFGMDKTSLIAALSLGTLLLLAGYRYLRKRGRSRKKPSSSSRKPHPHRRRRR